MGKQSWDNVNKDKLKSLYCDECLSDSQIAKMYGVKYSQVRYKRNKYGISVVDRMYEDFMSENKSVVDVLNSASKERLLRTEKIDEIAKAITRYSFRDGPIEDIHTAGKLSQQDMKTLNKFMINRVAGILTMIANNQWLKVELLVDYYKGNKEWDMAVPDTEVIDAIYEEICSED